MSAAVTLATWFLVFAGWFVLALVFAVLVGRFMGLGERQAREQEAERLELEGSWEDFLALRTERRERAERRHSDRRAA